MVEDDYNWDKILRFMIKRIGFDDFVVDVVPYDIESDDNETPKYKLSFVKIDHTVCSIVCKMRYFTRDVAFSSVPTSKDIVDAVMQHKHNTFAMSYNADASHFEYIKILQDFETLDTLAVNADLSKHY